MAKTKQQPTRQPKPGDPFRFRGNDYEVAGINAESGAIRIRRPDDAPKVEGHYRQTDGNLDDVRWAPEGFWYFRHTVAESMRGLPLAEQQAVQLMPVYADGRDDLALAAFHGEPRGVPGAKSVFHGREHLRDAARGIAEQHIGAPAKAEEKRARRGAKRVSRVSTRRG